MCLIHTVLMTRPSDGIGRLGTGPVEGSLEGLCAATNCGAPEVAVAVGLFLLTAALFLLAGSVLSQLREARDAVSVERTRARAERDAFEQFRQRVIQLDAGHPQPAGPRPEKSAMAAGGGRPPASSASTKTRSAPGSDLATVRRAYRETVMETPHFETEYDETLAEHVAEEFTPSVAAAVTGSGTLTPELQTTLANGAATARDRRAKLLADLDQEVAALSAAEDVLNSALGAAREVETDDLGTANYADLEADWERLGWHEEQVESLLLDRQESVRERATGDGEDPGRWFDYLYAPLNVRYPVLATGTDVLERLSRIKSTVAGALGRA